MDRRMTGSALTGKGGITMPDREKVIKAIETCYTLGHNCTECPFFTEDDCNDKMMHDALALLKEQDSFLGIQQTEDGITFISTGTAHQGEARGILLGKLLMHEWIYKELLYKGLLTDDIQSVFEQAKHI